MNIYVQKEGMQYDTKGIDFKHIRGGVHSALE